ncbi:MAG: bacillithiol biosynthesis cysteine-adding enzyme BshC [Candidatus Zixiibacteriota bacterium]
MTLKTAAQTSPMVIPLVAPDKLGYSKLYLDFLAGKAPARGLYPAESSAAVAELLERTQFERARLIDILKRQNQSYGASSITLQNIEKLRDKRSVCVFAGQQAGLFGGPLFTIIKALAAVKLARLTEERLGRPVVPVFWMAGDDHDFAEINHAFVLSRQGEIARVAYETPPTTELPASEIVLENSTELERVLTELGEHLGQTDFTPALTERLRRAYTHGETVVGAFAKLMSALTGELGLVFFNPGDPAVKLLARPLFESLLRQQDAIRETLTATNNRLRQNGYHLQVEKKDNATHLFCKLGGRTPIIREGEGYSVGSRFLNDGELARLLADHPDLFSPDVLTRPLLQAWLFPVAAQIGGPSEIAYFAQLNGLFALIDRPAPYYTARPTLTIVDRRSEQLIREMGIAFEDLLGDIEQVVNRVLGQTFPADLQADYASLRKAVEDRFRQFSHEALGFDPGLRETAEQVRGKIDFLLNGFEAKLFAAHKKKSQQMRERIYRIAHTLYPRHGLQERTLNINYFLSRYGLGLIPYLYEQMKVDEPAHQLVSLGEYEPR